MRAKCAWCRKDLGGRRGPKGELTHGICGPCMAAMLGAYRAKRSAIASEKRSEDEDRHFDNLHGV